MEYVTLSNGLDMPILGYGVYQIPPEDTEKCVLDALEVGYRSIDTAQAYHNEEGVGSAMKKSGIIREDIFLTTKVWISNAGYREAKASIEGSLARLQTDYLDLCLIHQPYGDYYGTWKAMEELYNEKKILAIGISNFSAARMIDLASFNEVVPMVNQVQTNPYYQEKETQKYMEEYGVQMEAWAPLAEGRDDIFHDPVLSAIAVRYKMTVPQIILRWLIQRKIVVIPKSVHKDYIAENFDVFDFALADDDMAAIAALDSGTNTFLDHDDPEAVKKFVQMAKDFKE
ncbi:MAG: aldo/keto reductase [Eggerthellaceae bacterium]|nr:aldo/keto reductase [Eggerthellaceae bacterium]